MGGRWSDVPYVDHVVVEKGCHGSLAIYTTEQNTSTVGARREQYLPLVVPWEGVGWKRSWMLIRRLRWTLECMFSCLWKAT